MFRLIGFLLAVTVIGGAFAWLANRPGELLIEWQGYHIETSVFRAFVILITLIAAALFVWSILRHVWHSPAVIGNLMMRRRQKRGLEALSVGMIALGAGDRATATRSAIQARKSLPNEPLTHLLRAQAAQLSGDRATARRIFEAMLASPDTEQLGLRGLYLEAERVGETEAARHFAERALKLNSKLEWATDGLFQVQCRQSDWAGALKTLEVARKNGQVDKKTADRRRAVLLTAQAQEAEEHNPEAALNLALDAHGLAPGLVPAAAIAGRVLASRGNTPRATKILQKTWVRSQHPDLATAYAYARIGDSPRDRLDRVQQLSALTPSSPEGPIAVAITGIEAREYEAARAALKPLLHDRLTQRIATLMARIEGAEHGDKGRVREWLARAVNAPRDPAWTADGVVADRWAPISPVTGTLDAFEWRVPVESMNKSQGDLLARKLEELVALGSPEDITPPASEAPVATAPTGPKATDATVVAASPVGPAEPAAEDKGSVPATTVAKNEKTESTARVGAAETAAKVPVTKAAEAPASIAPKTRGEEKVIREISPPREVSTPEEAVRTRVSDKPGAKRDRDPRQIDRRGEPRVIVAPHAPDDPGPDDAGDQDDIAPPLRPQRA